MPLYLVVSISHEKKFEVFKHKDRCWRGDDNDWLVPIFREITG